MRISQMPQSQFLEISVRFLGEFFTWSLKNAYIVKSLKCIPFAFCHRLALDKNGLNTFLKVDKSQFFCFSFPFQKMIDR